MKSFFRDLSGKRYLKHYEATRKCPAHEQHVHRVNKFLEYKRATGIQEYARRMMPSELWIKDEAEIVRKGTELLPDENGELRKLTTETVSKNKWKDDDVKKVMEARKQVQPSENVSTDFLSELGQRVRHDFVGGVIIQCMRIRRYKNASYCRMHRFMITRATIEIILEFNNVKMPPSNIDSYETDWEILKEELRGGLLQLIRLLRIKLEDLVHHGLLQRSQ